MQYHIIILLLIMIAFGVLGGIINYIILIEKDNSSKKHGLLKSILLGVAASFLVPLFLNMISSNLISESSKDMYKLFYFAGFCLVASISSRAFINTITDKVLKQVQEDQKEFMNQVEPILVKEIEMETGENGLLQASAIEVFSSSEENEEAVEKMKKLRIFESDDLSDKVIKAIGNSKYAYRTSKALAESIGVNENSVLEMLAKQMDRNLIVSMHKGNTRFYGLTETGRIKLRLLRNYVEGKITDIDFKEKRNEKSVFSVELDGLSTILIYTADDSIPLAEGEYIAADTVDGEKVDIKHVKVRKLEKAI